MKTIYSAGSGALMLALVLSGPVLAYHTPPDEHPNFAQLDVDGNGVLSMGEAQGIKDLPDHWKKVDRNADGVIERSEFAAFESERTMLTAPPMGAQPEQPIPQGYGTGQ
jgi:hypothetical protein